MKITTRTLSFLFAFLLILTLASCSSGKYEVSEDRTEMSESIGDAMGGNAAQNAALSDRKIIRTYNYRVETKDFDALLAGLKNKAAALGGYVEESYVSGNRMQQSRNRDANLTLRIPASESETFSAFLSDESVVVSENVSTEDVTKNYVDTESRLSALRSEKEALEEILKKAESVTDIIAIRSQLTDVIYQIESFESNLRNYDNLVEYTTVFIAINEVSHTSQVGDQTVWQKIGGNLASNFARVGEGLEAVFVFSVSAIPFLLIPCALVLILILFVKLRKRKKK